MQETNEYWFIFQNDSLLIAKETDPHEVKLPADILLSQLKSLFLRQHKLGLFNNAICYCAEIKSDTRLPDNVEAIPLRNALDKLGIDWYAAATKASSIVNWDKNHQFCGRCGAQTTHKPGLFERICEQCGLHLYPRISPSMIVMIQKNDRILMARSPHFKPGVHALIAGFVEAGESIEDAIHREVQEEVGIKIKNLRYFGSQSWPFPDSLMIGFRADYASGELTLDHQEIEAAGWYRYNELPGLPSSSISISRKLIDEFIQEQTPSSNR